MISVSHSLIGGAIGLYTPNIWLSLGLGFISHFLADAIPHWDYLQNVSLKNLSHMKKIALDLIIAFGLIGFLSWDHDMAPYIWAGAIGGVLPDILEGAYRNFGFMRFLKPLSAFHHWIHAEKRLTFKQGGWVVTLSVILVPLLIFLNY